VSRFGFEEPDAVRGEDGPVVGIGEAAGGRIRAEVAAEGRLSKLEIAPEVLRHNREGRPVMDSTALAAEITGAVNAAIEDAARRAATAALSGSATAELNEVSATFERSIAELTAELERTERRIEGR
jgi:DNA-binding protein YbaB